MIILSLELLAFKSRNDAYINYLQIIMHCLFQARTALKLFTIRCKVCNTYYFFVSIVVSLCFLLQVSLLLGTIIRKVPLPSNAHSDLAELEGPSVDAAGFSSDPVLGLEQLQTIGNHFLEVLLKMKHNGAIDKTRAGFTALCNRLLCSSDPRCGYYYVFIYMKCFIDFAC